MGSGGGNFTVLMEEDGRDSKEAVLAQEGRRKAGGNCKDKGE